MGYGFGILPGVRPPPLVAIPTALSGPRVLLRPYLPRDAAAFLEAIEESRAHLEPWLPWVQSVRSLADARADRHVFALIPEDCAALAWLARSGGGARDDPS